ncbi:transcription factor TCP4-like, partial [Helianthus annuus]|uniref:transcription factor TCP4-like n=1 Tax=Helianthus annuus TaxID=4232 RepID=UPI001652EF10
PSSTITSTITVDWLIKKAKAAIDELAELPAWTPTAGKPSIVNLEQNPNQENGNYAQNSSFLPASVDLVKSFFPIGGSGSSMAVGNTGLSVVQFHRNFPQNQDLKLSLQSFQDQMPQHQTVPLFGQPTNNQLLNYISQMGPLQSSNSPPVRAWVDPHQTPGFHHPFSLPGLLGGGARRQRRRDRESKER